VDPKGEVETWSEIQARLSQNLQHSTYACEGTCMGKAWGWRGAEDGENYPTAFSGSLRTIQPISLPADSAPALTFSAMWDIEAPFYEDEGKCGPIGWDGVQVRVSTLKGSQVKTTAVVRPKDGYPMGPGNQSVVRIFKSLNPSGDCSDWEGWFGQSKDFNLSNPTWIPIEIDLSEFAGQDIEVSVFFASDDVYTAKGFYFHSMKVMDGATTIFNRKGERGDGFEPMFTMPAAPKAAGYRDTYSRVPVVVGYPDGVWPDSGLKKQQTSNAAWSATWQTQSESSALMRTYLGNVYSSDMMRKYTHTLVANASGSQEACVTWQAPYSGKLEKVTLWTLVAKIGMDQVFLQVRRPEAPYEAWPGFGRVLSGSPQLTDPGLHTFFFEEEPGFKQGASFMMCVGISRLRRLEADLDLPASMDLPITEAPGMGHGSILLEACEQQKAPWGADYAITLRAEFVEATAEETRAFVTPPITDAICTPPTGPDPTGPDPTGPDASWFSRYGWILGLLLGVVVLAAVFGLLVQRRRALATTTSAGEEQLVDI